MKYTPPAQITIPALPGLRFSHLPFDRPSTGHGKDRERDTGKTSELGFNFGSFGISVWTKQYGFCAVWIGSALAPFPSGSARDRAHRICHSCPWRALAAALDYMKKSNASWLEGHGEITRAFEASIGRKYEPSGFARAGDSKALAAFRLAPLFELIEQRQAPLNPWVTATPPSATPHLDFWARRDRSKRPTHALQNLTR